MAGVTVLDNPGMCFSITLMLTPEGTREKAYFSIPKAFSAPHTKGQVHTVQLPGHSGFS